MIVLTTNIQAGAEGNFVILSNSRNQGGYDFLSVMHYNRNSFATNPSYDTLEPKPAYSQYLNIMGQMKACACSVSRSCGSTAFKTMANGFSLCAAISMVVVRNWMS